MTPTTRDTTEVRPGMAVISRRRVIGRLAAAGFSVAAIGSILRQSAWAQEATPAASPPAGPAATPVAGGPDPIATLRSIGKSERLIAHGTTNFETPAELFTDFLTPNDVFFVRSNGPVSIDIAPEDWRLNLTGLVDRELELTLDDLKGMNVRTITAFLECSGNSRGRFGDQPDVVEGTKWGNGAIGNAEWTGVPVVDLLNEAGVQEDAVDLVSQGGDFAEMQRGLPIAVASDPDVMLVWEMNGEPLPAPNGGPVRLLVPGWGGIASTKWCVGLEVIDHPFEGHYNVESYVIIDEEGTIVRPVREMPVSSAIVDPLPGADLSAGTHTITGFAWSGYGGIMAVDVTTDGGASWNPATIVDEDGPRSWVRFTYEWEAVPGEIVLGSRATDQLHLQQPLTTPWNAKGYLMNEIYDVPVQVS